MHARPDRRPRGNPLLAAATILAVVLAACPAPRAEEADWPRVLADLAAQAEAAGTTVVRGRQGWLFFAPELRHLSAGRFWGAAAAGASRAPDPAASDPLPAILDFRDQLRDLGVELLFVPVPAKAAVYSEMLPAGGGGDAIDAADRAFLEELRRHGVAVLDLGALFRAEKASGPPLYCRQDTHWSPRACELTARRIAATVADRPWLAAVAKEAFEVRRETVEIRGDLWRQLPEPRPPRERLEVAVVGRQTAVGLEPVTPSRTSPVLLLGDSHTLVFHAGGDLHARGAGLADHLARELGFAVDLLGVRGSGATPARVSLLRRGDGLAGKKLVIWCLSVREYTEGQGWRKVPVTRR